MHKIVSQMDAESYTVDSEDILADTQFAKSTLNNVGGTSPYVAVFGRQPSLLSDFESSACNTIADEDVTGSLSPATSQGDRIGDDVWRDGP